MEIPADLRSAKYRGAFHSTQNSGNFGWYIEWDGPFRFGPTRIFRTSFEDGPLWPDWSFRSVGRTEMPLSLWQNRGPQYRSYVLWQEQWPNARWLGWGPCNGYVQFHWHVKFPKFQTGILLNGKRPRSKLRVPDKDDVKQKTSFFSVQGKICLVFRSFVLRDLCPVNEVNAEVYDQWN